MWETTGQRSVSEILWIHRLPDVFTLQRFYSLNMHWDLCFQEDGIDIFFSISPTNYSYKSWHYVQNKHAKILKGEKKSDSAGPPDQKKDLVVNSLGFHFASWISRYRRSCDPETSMGSDMVTGVRTSTPTTMYKEKPNGKFRTKNTTAEPVN